MSSLRNAGICVRNHYTIKSVVGSWDADMWDVGDGSEEDYVNIAYRYVCVTLRAGDSYTIAATSEMCPGLLS